MKETSGFFIQKRRLLTSVLKHNFGLFFVLLVGDFSFQLLPKVQNILFLSYNFKKKKKLGAALLKTQKDIPNMTQKVE